MTNRLDEPQMHKLWVVEIDRINYRTLTSYQARQDMYFALSALTVGFVKSQADC